MTQDTGLDQQRIAALLDGRLSDPERAKLISELASDPSAREAFSDVAAVADAMKVSRAGAIANARFPSTRVAALAAAAVFIVVGGFLLNRWIADKASYENPVFALAEPNQALPLVANTPPWEVERGDEGGLSETARAARLGVLFLHLEIAVRTRDTTAAQLASAIRSSLEDIPASGPTAALLDSVVGPRGVLHVSDAKAATINLVSPEFLQLGAWGEAARIAEARADSAFFTSDHLARAIERGVRIPRDMDARLDSLLNATLQIVSSPVRTWREKSEAAVTLLRRITR